MSPHMFFKYSSPSVELESLLPRTEGLSQSEGDFPLCSHLPLFPSLGCGATTILRNIICVECDTAHRPAYCAAKPITSPLSPNFLLITAYSRVSLQNPMPMLSTSNFPWSMTSQTEVIPHSGRVHTAYDNTP